MLLRMLEEADNERECERIERESVRQSKTETMTAL